MIAATLGALHPVLVSFPLVLITTVIFIEIWAFFALRRAVEVPPYSRILLIGALVFATLAYFSGHEASEAMNQTFIVPDSAVSNHFFSARLLLFTLIPCLIIKFVCDSAKYHQILLKGLFYILLLASFGLVVYTGWLGGRLVFEHGARVSAQIPKLP